MLSAVNELAIVVSALLSFAVGSIWYSPLLFGKHWQRAAELTDTDLTLSRFSLLRSILIGLLSNIVVMYVIATLLRLGERTGLSWQYLGGLLIALFAASVANMVIWEKKSSMYFLIHVGYGVLVIGVGCCVMALWPW